MPNDFKDRLRQTREARGLSQLDLANKTAEGGKPGLQPAAISHFETGQRAPSFDNLKKLADALSVSIDYLLGRIDEEQHGQGIAAAPRAQQLFRNAEKLSEEGFSQLEMMAQMLREREEKKKGGST
jgi:transcriptional regulator with XRE-family HTH domain